MNKINFTSRNNFYLIHLPNLGAQFRTGAPSVSPFVEGDQFGEIRAESQSHFGR